MAHLDGADNPHVVYKLRDNNSMMTTAWMEYFSDCHNVEVSLGDIFKGGPTADAIVSPANSFGFMDGGIDMVYTNYFGWQMQRRLQKVINDQYNGEILVGQAVIIPAYEIGANDKEYENICDINDRKFRYLISAPTMRVPHDVSSTVNAFLAFRSIILAVKQHNTEGAKMPITSVLCPGLGTAVGKMPKNRCAYQMHEAYKMYELGERESLHQPGKLGIVWTAHEHMASCCISRNSTDDPPLVRIGCVLL